jgi:short-subunit dehydrogenase
MKRILIFGANSAIARECARIWAARGHSLFLAGRDAGRLDALLADLRVRGSGAVNGMQMDANDISAHAAVLETALQQLGRLDIVLIAHGTLPDQRLCQQDAVALLKEFSTNATSVMALLTLVANRFESQRSGAIGVITSVAGDRGRPSNYVYGSAKAAVSTFCEGLRARLFPCGVSLTDIRPGFVATPMTQGLPMPGALVSQPAAVARRIVAGIERGRDVLYAPAYWSLIMLVIKMMPRFLFKRLKL